MEPLFDPLEMEEAKTALQYQAEDLPPELWLGEAMQTAAKYEQQDVSSSSTTTKEE